MGLRYLLTLSLVPPSSAASLASLSPIGCCSPAAFKPVEVVMPAGGVSPESEQCMRICLRDPRLSRDNGGGQEAWDGPSALESLRVKGYYSSAGEPPQLQVCRADGSPSNLSVFPSRSLGAFSPLLSSSDCIASTPSSSHPAPPFPCTSAATLPCPPTRCLGPSPSCDFVGPQYLFLPLRRHFLFVSHIPTRPDSFCSSQPPNSPPPPPSAGASQSSTPPLSPRSARPWRMQGQQERWRLAPWGVLPSTWRRLSWTVPSWGSGSSRCSKAVASPREAIRALRGIPGRSTWRWMERRWRTSRCPPIPPVYSVSLPSPRRPRPSRLIFPFLSWRSHRPSALLLC